MHNNDNSPWTEKYVSNFSSLENDETYDIAIIGGGIAGVTAGIELKNAGYKVVVIEKNKISSGTTGGTTGKASIMPGLFYSDFIRQFNLEIAHLYINEYKKALTRLEKMVSNLSVDCGWLKEDHYIYTNNPNNLKRIKDEYKSFRKLDVIVNFSSKPFDLPFLNLGGIKLEKQAKFNAYIYTNELAKLIDNQGSRVYEKTEMKGLSKGEKIEVKTNRGSIFCNKIVIATKVPPYPLFGRLSYAVIMYPETSYIVAGETKLILNGMYNSPDKEHYSLMNFMLNDKNHILVGGENHIPGLSISQRRYKKLTSYAENIFNVTSINYKWKAMDYIAYDKVPIIGPLYPRSDKIYVISGFKKWGLVSSNLAAKIVCEYINGNVSRLGSFFNPHRLSAPANLPFAVRDYLRAR